MNTKRLWLAFGAVMIGSFAVLGYFGMELYRQAPPIPERIVVTGGEVLFPGQDISDGQNVWQSMGGQEVVFVAVAFSNLVGAGLFGFLINPPIALYYMQGLNTTAVHAHTALFGVYGMLGIGLMLFCFRVVSVRQDWRTRFLSFDFWSINIAPALMVLIGVLPVGLMQTWRAWNMECGTHDEPSFCNRMSWAHYDGFA